MSLIIIQETTLRNGREARSASDEQRPMLMLAHVLGGHRGLFDSLRANGWLGDNFEPQAAAWLGIGERSRVLLYLFLPCAVL